MAAEATAASPQTVSRQHLEQLPTTRHIPSGLFPQRSWRVMGLPCPIESRTKRVVTSEGSAAGNDVGSWGKCWGDSGRMVQSMKPGCQAAQRAVEVLRAALRGTQARKARLCHLLLHSALPSLGLLHCCTPRSHQHRTAPSPPRQQPCCMAAAKQHAQLRGRRTKGLAHQSTNPKQPQSAALHT